ncbi:PD-(D/E)XK nuclease family protein [Dissulfuribacter thermophilus]|nr:PD-(D/E)XK nuclease family protein [Dissulfuribacter thermophilus]
MNEIIVVHPRQNLLNIVMNDLLKKNEPWVTTVLLPNRRAGLFLKHYLSKRVHGPFLLPRILTLEEWIKEIYLNHTDSPKEFIDEYDQAWIIFEAYKSLVEKNGARPPLWDDFFPWAMRIQRLFEELDLELTDPKNIEYPPTETLSRVAISILERLGDLYGIFHNLLEERGLITYSRLFYEVARTPSSFLQHENPENFLIVGFYALTNAEDQVFRWLFDNGARIYWHSETDPLPELYRRWKENWKVAINEVECDSCKEESPTLSFFEAHDLHAELKELKKGLSKIDDFEPDRCAVVPLLNTSLIPLLHHLPDVPVNLTMGYPLNLTGPYTFIKLLMNIVSGLVESKFHLKDLIEFLRGPYTDYPGLVDALREYGAPFVTKEELIQIANRLGIKKEILLLIEEILIPFETARSTKDLCLALNGVISYLKSRLLPDENDENIESNSSDLLKLDLSVLMVLEENVLPILENGFFSHVPMTTRGLFRFFEDISSSIRIPFEGEPLSGIQVMGLLETRLINFEEIFFIDVNEGVFPGSEEVDPILPYGMRIVLGLPDRYREELILKYHFERLIKGSKVTHLMWQYQTNKASNNELEAKKVRSRFIEKLIWEIEKKEAKPLSPNERVKFSRVDLPLNGIFSEAALKKDEEHLRVLRTRLGKISPTALELYLTCPKKFYFEKILGLSPGKVPEEIDHGAIGTAVHKALERYYRELTVSKAYIKKDELDIDRLFLFFKEILQGEEFFQHLSSERRYLVFKGAYFRLKKFIECQPNYTEIQALEKVLKKRLSIYDDFSIELFGIADRIDKRDQHFLILDYKTGYVEEINGLKLMNFNPSALEATFNEDSLLEFREQIGHIQLPFYNYLFCTEKQGDFKQVWHHTTAAYVDLRKTGKEQFLIKPDKLGEEWGEWLKADFIEGIKFLIKHILHSPYWYPATDPLSCRWCDYRDGCKHS